MADKKSILLRISPELWERLNRWARDDLRSLNAQIEFVLREAAHKRTGRDPPNAMAAVDPPQSDGDGAAVAHPNPDT